MKDEKKYIVYMHTTPSGKVYVGITANDISRRWQNGSGYRGNEHFYNAILKYGWDNIKHEILFTDLSADEASKIEMELIEQYDSMNPSKGYNRSIGGEINIPSEETKNKIRNALKGRTMPQSTKEKIRKAKTGQTHVFPLESRKRFSEARKGANNPMYGRHFSKEHVEKIAKANGVPVKCIETGMVYFSANEAQKQTGINDWCIGEVCKHKRKSAGGLHWEYAKGCESVV